MSADIGSFFTHDLHPTLQFPNHELPVDFPLGSFIHDHTNVGFAIASENQHACIIGIANLSLSVSLKNYLSSAAM